MENASTEPDRGAEADHHAQVVAGLGKGGPDVGPTFFGDGKGKNGVEKVAEGGEGDDGNGQRDEDRPSEEMKGLPVQNMGFEVDHGGPDPHGGKQLDQRQAPVGHQQLHPLEQHGQGADRECEGGEIPAFFAQLDHHGLDLVVVAPANGFDQAGHLSEHDTPPGLGALGHLRDG